MVMKSNMKKDALKILFEGLKVADPENAVKSSLSVKGDILRIKDREYDLRNFENVYVVGAGKASGRMAKAVEDILDERIRSGFVITKKKGIIEKKDEKERTKRIEIVEGSHPIPDERSVEGARK
jgi:Putative glycerate kinase